MTGVQTCALPISYTKDGGKAIQGILDREFFKEAKISEFRGENILIRGVIERYLLNLLKWDERHAPITMVAMEEDFSMEIETEVDGKPMRIKTGGRVDRMDITGDSPGVLRIVDYKTGAHQDKPSVMANLFANNSKHAKYYLQTFLYAIAARKTRHETMRIKPVLFYPVLSGQPDYDPTLAFGSYAESYVDKNGNRKGPIEDITEFEQEYVSELKNVISEIFSTKTSFTKTEELRTCEYCDFKALCNR